MKILLMTAMNKELVLVREIMEERSERQIADKEVTFGRIGRHEIAACSCGIGKVNSAVNTYRLIEEFCPDLVVNSGVAGGAGAAMAPGELLVADGVAYHDVWCGPSTPYGAADGFPVIMVPDQRIVYAAGSLSDSGSVSATVRTGLICSGDKFITTAEEINQVREHFPSVMAVDMESASIAQTCMMFGLPFNIIRIVSDTPGAADNVSQYENFWEEAPVKTFSLVSELIRMI